MQDKTIKEQTGLNKPQAQPEKGPGLSGAGSQLYHIVEHSNEIFYMHDLEGNLTYISPQVIPMIGYDPKEATRLKWTDILTDNPINKAGIRFTEIALKTGQRQKPYLLEFYRKDGGKILLEVDESPICDQSGRVIGLVGAGRDVTQRESLARELKKQREELQVIFDSAPTMIFYKDKDNKMVRVNQAFAEAMGMSREEIEGKSCFELWPHQAEDYWRDDREVINNGIPKIGIVEPLFTRHGERWVQTEKVPYRNEKGEIVGVIGLATDITDRKETLEALRLSEEEYRTLVNNVNIGVYRTTPDSEGRFIKANPAMAKMFGYDSEQELTSHRVIELYHDPRRRIKFLEKIRENGFVKNEEMLFRKKNGSPVWVSVTARLNLGEDGKPLWLDGVIEDITERKQAADEIRESEERFRTLFDNATDGIVVVDIASRKFYLGNKMFSQMLGRSQEEIALIGVEDIHPKEDLPHVLKEFEKLAEKEINHTLDIPVKRKDGSIFFAEISTSHITMAGKTYMMGIFRDITERKKARQELELLNKELTQSNKRLRQLVLRDPQTGLFNHRYVEEAIEAEFYRAKRYVHPLSVMMVDIDYFKSINDVYGHHFGDTVLKQLARQLKKMVRQYDVVVRFGGEEFMIISPAIDRAQAMALARRLLDAINLYNFGDKNQTVKLKLSIAVSSYPEDKIFRGMDLVSLAEQILNKVKDFGGNNVYSSSAIDKKAVPIQAKSRLNGDIRFLRDKIEKLTRKTNQSLVEAVFAFAKTIELKDQYTGEHVERTVHYATEIARAMNLSEEEIERIKQAAILHDLGKIGISEKILSKDGKLTKSELEDIKRHPQIGVDIIRPIKFLHNVIPLILHHHERWDGKGYPAGLKGEEIPLGSRIVALADVYEALTSNRPYRKAYSEKEAINLIKKGSGSQFDPRVVTKFLQLATKHK